MALIGLLKSPGPNGLGYNTTAEQVTEGLSLAGQTYVVSGCNVGLGLETARVLALRGARVLGLARNREKAEAVCQSLPTPGRGFACELADVASVTACAAAIKKAGFKPNAIICNAGIMALPQLQQVDGYEKQFFTNHIGHFLLVNELLPCLDARGRVVVVSSSAHHNAPEGGIQFDNLSGERGYKPWAFYGQSKMANLLFAKALQRRFAQSGQTAYAVHPGVIKTQLARSMNPAVGAVLTLLSPLFLKTVSQGAATTVFAAVDDRALPLAGQYLADCNAASTRREADDEALAARLWEVSEAIVDSLKARHCNTAEQRPVAAR